MTATAPIVIRNIFPARSECPACKRYGHVNVSGGPAGAPFYYRKCTACGTPYKVLPIAREIDDGGAWSRVEVLS